MNHVAVVLYEVYGIDDAAGKLQLLLLRELHPVVGGLQLPTVGL